MRYPIIDMMRVLAIALMVVFHLFYDLTLFKFVGIDFQNDPFWFWLPRFIVLLFLLCVGMGLCLSNKEKIQWIKVKRRFLKLTALAAVISIYTYFAFPKNWIYFGTLHCIAICSVLALPFINYPRTSLIVGLAINILYWLLKLRFVPFSRSLKIVSMDYIPLHPWFGIVLIGIFLYHVNFHKIGSDSIRLPNWFLWISKQSLWIYVLHQIILYGIVYTAYIVLS